MGESDLRPSKIKLWLKLPVGIFSFLRYACVATLKSCNQGKCCNPYSGIDTHLHVYEITGKSLSEALLFEEHGENMLRTKLVLNVRNNFCTQHVLPRFELGIFMY